VDARLQIAGADDPNTEPWSPALERLLDELHLRESVELLGALPEEALRAAHERAHLFVLPSRHEPLGVALMEAMAMGAPVLATRAGGVPELIEDGRTGFLVEPDDAAALARRIREILDRPEQARLAAEAGRQRVRARFHSGVSARLLGEEILRRHPAAAAP
jgi:glycosyltransferase involved in cell wall biosynthesis